MFTRFALVVMGHLAIAGHVASQEKLPDAPISAREAAARMTVPDGFKVTLFAGEPDVVQPIAFTFDDRGRLWVVENFSYPKWNKEIATEKTADGRVIDKRKGKDRVVILEDTDGDGVHDKRTVFADNLTNLSGIEYGFGGIWLCSIPNLIYIPIKATSVQKGDADLFEPKKVRVPFLDEPGGPPEIKLDGWSLQSGHNAFNSLKWGPDGWLYGCNGILATSQVGAPGTPDKERTPMNCGVWRYHPTKKKFEVFAHGTTNPWGLDWDQYGELFITNCVIDHVWHVVPGGHYERMYGQDFNPHLYKLMPSIADHKHWAGGSWTESRGGKGAHSDAGGGHAHVGCMIYQGDNWPEKYRNTLFTLNLHGNRINNDILERKGSTYVAKHGNDFLMANDPWFRGIGIDYGPDGGVYVSDWTDTGECHNYQVAHTATGRIYKVVFGTIRPTPVDLARMSNRDLFDLHSHRNEWYVRHARRLLHERAVAGKLVEGEFHRWIGDSKKQLASKPATQETARSYLNTLMTANVIGEWDNQHQLAALLAPGWDDSQVSPRAKAWHVARLCEPESFARLRQEPEALRLLLKIAQEHAAEDVRFSFVKGLQRLTNDQRWELAEALLSRGDDLNNATTSLLLWYAVEPLPSANLEKSVALLGRSKFSIVREFLARRIASLPAKSQGIESLVAIAKRVTDPNIQRDILAGLQESLKGRRSHPMPNGWDTVYPVLAGSQSIDVRNRAMALAVVFGDGRALEAMEKLVGNVDSPTSLRRAALQALIGHQSPKLIDTLHALLEETELRPIAIQALAAYADPKTPTLILQRYAKLTADEKADAVHTLASRPAYALALLDAVADKTVARTDLNAFTVRQLLALNDKQVTKRVNEVWGTLRPASADKAALMTKYKNLLTADTMKSANLANGRFLYKNNCASCHKLFGEGGAIGPELTGSQRANLDYVLENMLDPSAVVPREYQVQVIVTDSGRTITGIVKEETDRAVTVQTQNEVIIVPKGEIDSRRGLNVSMMPEGALDRLTITEIRDLVGYLASPMQVVAPK